MRDRPGSTRDAVSRAAVPGATARFRRSGTVVAGIVALQLGVLMWLEWWPSPRPLWGDEIMYRSVAAEWAAGHSTTLEPLWPPLYPRMLATVMWLCGSRLALQVLQVAMLAGAAWVMRDVVRRWLDPSTAAVAAAWLVADPQIMAFAFYLWPEVPHLLLVCVAAWIVTIQGRDWFWHVGLGVVLGLALLTKSLLGPLIGLSAGVALLTAGRGALVPVGLVLTGLVATIAPTAIDLHARHGTVMPGDSARFNIWVGLNDRSSRNLVDEIVGDEFNRYRTSAPRHVERNRVLQTRLVGLVQEKGVWGLLAGQWPKQYLRLFDKDSFFTDQLPGGAIAGSGFGYRALDESGARLVRGWASGIYLSVLALAPFGAVIMWRRNRAAALALLAYAGYSVVLCLIVHVKTRYRVQFLPALYIWAAVALVEWRAHPRRLRVPPPWTFGAAGVAATLWYLALANGFAS